MKIRGYGLKIVCVSEISPPEDTVGIFLPPFPFLRNRGADMKNSYIPSIVWNALKQNELPILLTIVYVGIYRSFRTVFPTLILNMCILNPIYASIFLTIDGYRVGI